MPAESKELDTKCPEPFGGKSGGWVLLQLIVVVWFIPDWCCCCTSKLLIISQLLSKTCKVILLAPRSWRLVCAIQTFESKHKLLRKLQNAQTCLLDLGADKMTFQVLLRSWEMMSNFEVQQQHQSGMNHTTWHESVTNLAEMNNCRGFGRNVVQYRSPLRTYNPPTNFYAVIY